jgi:hypothetical protein
VLVDAVSSVKLNALVSIDLFPNPTSQGNPVQIQAQSPIELVSVFTTDGRLVYQSMNASTYAEVPSHELQAGVYFMRVVSCGVVSSHRLVIVQ